MLAEFCFGALLNGRAVAERGEAPQWAWLFNSAVGLPWLRLGLGLGQPTLTLTNSAVGLPG
jgi:hypothetical protein